MSKIINKKKLASGICMLEVHAPQIAAKASAGQFVVVVADEKGERIPLTIADWDKDKGAINLIFQVVGFSSEKLCRLSVGDELSAILGPLGTPTHLEKIGTVIAIAGGVGIAEIFPVVRGFKQASNKVITIIGSRSKDLLILQDKLGEVSDEFLPVTDDGTSGKKGLVTDVLKVILEKNKELSQSNCLIYAVGPVKMMQAVAEISRAKNIKTLVSLNPIMVDATGMCGACRVKVAGKTRFACVDGPEFDAHEVDFEQLLVRLGQHQNLEHKSWTH